jgi:Ca2+-binding EF-hand superfamily protein|tara:strand:+ start:504 stop:851 length:348 start_codon:yes stop_codon:yes gene_type:complete
MADFFEREMNFHVKAEMLKYDLHNAVNWNTKSAFNMIDNQREGLLNQENIRLFLSLNYYEASDDELMAIVRRFERKGTGVIDFQEFRKAIEPVAVNMNKEVDDHKHPNMSISPNG